MIVANLQQMLRLDQSTRCTLSSLFGGGGRFNCVLVEPGINCCICYQRQSINRSHIVSGIVAALERGVARGGTGGGGHNYYFSALRHLSLGAKR